MTVPFVKLFNMMIVTMDDMQNDLLGCFRLVQNGETLVIMQADEPIAELKPLPHLPHPPRPFGIGAGDFVVSDDFDAPLPEEILQSFEGK